EWNVPRQFFPMCFSQVVCNRAFDFRAVEPLSDGLRPLHSRPLEFTKDHLPMINVINESWLDPVQANKAKTSHDLVRRKQISQPIFISEAVLECDDNCGRPDERRNQLLKLVVGSAFERDQDKVTWPDVF